MTEDDWVLSTFGLDMRRTDRKDTDDGGLSSAQANWSAGRGEVVASLKSLEQAIRAMKDPLSDPAIILVKAIAANLKADPPGTREEVTQLRSYLQTDDVIDDAEVPNGFGITIQIRKPLLPLLDALDLALPQ